MGPRGGRHGDHAGGDRGSMEAVSRGSRGKERRKMSREPRRSSALSPAPRAAPPTVLYIHHRPELGGAPTSMYQLLRALDRRRFRPVVFCPGGEAAELFASTGVPVYHGPICTF